MSASNQKKLRKEQAAAYMSERQRAEAKEQKKIKVYTATFWVVLALCLCIVLGTVLANPIKNMARRNTVAMTIGDHELNAVEVNYFYIDAVNAYVNQYSSYISMILDPTKPLNEQVPSGETVTWAQKFLTMAEDNIKSTYQLYDLAVAAGHKLNDEETKSVDTLMANLSLYAMYYGYDDAEHYLRNVYGNGADVDSYRTYNEVLAMATSYYSAYADALDFDDAALREFEKDKYADYNSYTYISYYLNAAKFREGGTKNDKGEITYTEDEKQAAIEKAKNYADTLAAGEYADQAALDEAIKALDFNKDVKEPTLSSLNEKVLHTKLNSLIKDWVAAEERVAGEMTVIAKESGTGDNKVVEGYYVIRFMEKSDNTYNLRDVRHVLIKFEGGKYNSSTGQTTYTEFEKNAAKKKAEELLAEWEKGDKSEASFIELAKKNSKDGNASEGGLYEEVYPGQMVKPFEDWLFDDERTVGSYGLVETEFGWHIMFYVGESDITYRDFMLTNDLLNKTLTEWHEGLVEKAVLVEKNLKYVDMDLVLKG